MDRPDPAEYQPRLSAWGHTWRYVLASLVGMLAWAETLSHQWDEHRPFVWLAIGLGVVSFVLVGFRRRWPLTVMVLTNVLSVLSAPAAGAATLAIVSVASRRRYREIAFTGVVSLASGIAFYEVPVNDTHEPFWLGLTFNIVVTSAILAWGMYIGSRRELLWALREQVRHAQEEQGLRADQARTAERARIAREMHDVLAHRISQISMHAGALAFREDLSAAQLREGVGEIQQRAHEALGDLRGVLGVLRDRGRELAPQPTYADLPCLVEDARAAGVQIEYDDRLVEAAELPAAVGRTVYRIVQEGLTNARKHAPGAHLSVTLTGSPEQGVEVELRNPLGFGPTTTPGSGLGLVGLRERTELRGGRLEYRRDHGAFVLHGWLPWAP